MHTPNNTQENNHNSTLHSAHNTASQVENKGGKSAVSTLLQLETDARRAPNLNELLFVIVNQTSNLINYRQAVFLGGDNEVKFVSNAASFDKHVPYIEWLKHLNKYFLAHNKLEIKLFLETDIPEEYRAGWHEWCQNYVVWVPLVHPRFGYVGSFICTRANLFKNNEMTLLKHLSETYAHALIALNAKDRKTIKQRFLSKKLTIIAIILVIFILAMFIPVRLSAIGESEVISKDYLTVRSPLEGTIETILVEPNENVKKDQVIAKLNIKNLENQLDIAYKELEIEKVKLKQLKQKALEDMRFSGDIVISKATMDTKYTEIAYLKDMISQANLKSPIDGVAVYSDRMELEGLPVHVGNKILDVANPKNTKVLVWLSVNDAMDIQEGNEVTLFLNTNPNMPISAKVVRMSYIAEGRPEGYMAYRIIAEFDASNIEKPRVGLRGVAKIYGNKTILGYYLFKRPILVVRQFFGI